MKKILIAGMLFIAVCFSASDIYAQKKDKFGHIDSNELLKLMPGRDSIVAQITEYATTLQNQLKGMESELQIKYDDYTTNADKWTPLIKQTKEKEIQDIQIRIETFQKSAEEDLQQKQGELLQPIIDKAKAAIESVAKTNGYTYVFDAGLGILLYAEPSDNILPLVKAELGIK